MVKMKNIYLKFCQEGWKNEWMESLGMRRQALHGEWLGFEEEEGRIFYGKKWQVIWFRFFKMCLKLMEMSWSFY